MSMVTENYINSCGIKCYRNISANSEFSIDMFQSIPNELRDDEQWALHTDIGSLTVMDRRTGYGWRDVETGFRDIGGKFWLASSDCDVRSSGCKTIGEAIEWVKQRANTCAPLATEDNTPCP